MTLIAGVRSFHHANVSNDMHDFAALITLMTVIQMTSDRCESQELNLYDECHQCAESHNVFNYIKDRIDLT